MASQYAVDVRKLIFVLFYVSEMQKKSDDDDNCASVEVGNVPALRHISAEIEPSWDSCASLPFLTYCAHSHISHFVVHCKCGS